MLEIERCHKESYSKNRKEKNQKEEYKSERSADHFEKQAKS